MGRPSIIKDKKDFFISLETTPGVALIEKTGTYYIVIGRDGRRMQLWGKRVSVSEEVRNAHITGCDDVEKQEGRYKYSYNCTSGEDILKLAEKFFRPAINFSIVDILPEEKVKEKKYDDDDIPELGL